MILLLIPYRSCLYVTRVRDLEICSENVHTICIVPLK